MIDAHVTCGLLTHVILHHTFLAIGLATVPYQPILCKAQNCGAVLNPYWYVHLHVHVTLYMHILSCVCDIFRMWLLFAHIPIPHDIFLLVSRVDFMNKIWVCPFCLTRNHFPHHYADITAEHRPAEIIPQYTTMGEDTMHVMLRHWSIATHHITSTHIVCHVCCSIVSCMACHVMSYHVTSWHDSCCGYMNDICSYNIYIPEYILDATNIRPPVFVFVLDTCIIGE